MESNSGLTHVDWAWTGWLGCLHNTGSKQGHMGLTLHNRLGHGSMLLPGRLGQAGKDGAQIQGKQIIIGNTNMHNIYDCHKRLMVRLCTVSMGEFKTFLCL